MRIYNQTSTNKKYIGGLLMGVLILPAIYLFIGGFVFYAIALVVIYLAFETSRTGVEFNFEQSKFTDFREILFLIRIKRKGSFDLNAFSHYRLVQQNYRSTLRANYVQYSTVSETHHTLELFDKHKDEFVQIVNGELNKVQPLLSKLEEQNLRLKD